MKMPSFTKGKPQLNKHEVDTTRELAHVRIHVERVKLIGTIESITGFPVAARAL